jgi:chemotaxis protein histidine kinase CheA
MDELGDALEIDESLVDVQMDGSEAEEEEADNRRASAKSKGKGKAPAKSDTRRSIAQRQRDEVDEDEQEEEEDPSEEQPRKSRLSTKSNRSHIGDTLSDVGDGDRTRASIGINMDDTFDDAGFEADNYGDASLDGFPGEEREDEAGAEDGDADMERDAMEEEDEPGLDEIQEEDVAEDEEEEEEPVARPVKTAAKKVKTRLPPAKSAGRGQREDSAAVREKKRKRLSNFPNGTYHHALWLMSMIG